MQHNQLGYNSEVPSILHRRAEYFGAPIYDSSFIKYTKTIIYDHY